MSVSSNTRELLLMTELPEAPWESVSTDYYGQLPSGEYLITVIDDYSRFPIIKSEKSTGAKIAIPIYDEIFSEFGIPKKATKR